jgi:hypothetical protein
VYSSIKKKARKEENGNPMLRGRKKKEKED